MKIGIAGPIASGLFSDYVDEQYKPIMERLDNAVAPAVTTLALELLNLGHELVIFTKDSRLETVEVLKGEKITIYVAPRNSKLSFIKHPFLSTYVSIKNIFKMHNGHLDVLSVHWTRDYAMAATYYQKKGVPVYVTIRDIIPYILKQQRGLEKLSWYIIYLKNEWVLRRKKFNFIANSEYTSRMVAKYWGKTVPVIPNPVSDVFLDLSSQNRSDKAFTIISISVASPLDTRKNILSLLRAFKNLYAKFPDMNLKLVGGKFTLDNPEVQKIREEGLLNGVELCGRLSHPKTIELLQISNLMVHPSLEETFGNTLVEAMAVGCPILGGIHSGAVPDVLDNGNAGYLCDVTDVDDIMKNIEYIYLNRMEVESKATYAKSYCRKKYSSKQVANQYLKLFTKD